MGDDAVPIEPPDGDAPPSPGSRAESRSPSSRRPARPPAPLLPPFWSTIGPWLPPGAGTDAVRTIVYFPVASLTRPVSVLGVYAVVGLIVTVLVAAMRLAPAPSRHAAPER
jgi:hypothetical protein